MAKVVARAVDPKNADNKETYVFIDVSNIRVSCLTSCGMNLDFVKFYQYFVNKYPNLVDVRYYEGVAKDDEEKKAYLYKLDKVGYTICPLKRKSFVEPARYGIVKCSECGHPMRVTLEEERVKLKSNVDVYLTSDMVECAATAINPIHIVLVSCDGDYVEAIHAVLRLAPPGSKVTVLATPKVKKTRENSLSTRLKNLCNIYEPTQFNIDSINNIHGKICRHLSKGHKSFIRRHKAEAR